MSSAASKPYLNLKQSLIQFFSTPTRYLKESNQKESAFEKPYYDGEYPTMHLELPTPDWPSWNFDSDIRTRRGRRFSGKSSGGVPVLGCPGCALYADPSFDCTNDPVEIHAGIYCTNTPGAATDRLLSGAYKERTMDSSGWSTTEDKTRAYGVQAGDTILETYAQVGSIKQVTVGAWAFIGPSAAVWVDPAISEHTICGRMVDGAGSTCIACVDVKCCGCDNPPSAFVIASFDSTIDPGGNAFVTVSGGCGPYSFAIIGGTGYTVTGANTVGTVTSASGVCGVDYTPTVTVRATDICGTTATCRIRNTGGVWEDIAGFSRAAPCDDAVWCCGFSGNSCAVNGTSTTVYHSTAGSGGAYYSKWVMVRILNCGKNPDQPDCREESNGNHTQGGGSTCGADTILASEYDCGTSACCECTGDLFYWTCGADCT